MSTSDAELVPVTIAGDISERDTEEIVEALNGVGLDAVVGPLPGRLGLPGDLTAILIEVPLEVLGAALLTTGGARFWRAVVTAARRRRERHTRDDGADGTAVAIHDPRTDIRLDLTLGDLADDRLLAELARLGELAKGTGSVVMHWDRAAGGWRALPEPSGQAGADSSR